MSDRPSFVLDASAVLALLNDEPGADIVAGHLDDAVVSSVNWSEVYATLRRAGVDGGLLEAGFAAIDVAIVPFDETDAIIAGELAVATRDAGLSLGDRACVALAKRLAATAVTADRQWLTVDVGVAVVCVR